MNKEIPPEPLDFFIWTVEDVGMWLEEINLGSYRQVFKENGVNGEYLEGMSMFTTEQILRFIRRCHMKWGDFITLCKELRRIKDTQLLPERKENTLHLIFEALALYLIARLHLHLPPAAFKTKLCCIHPNEVSVYVSSIIDQSLKSKFELPRDLSVSCNSGLLERGAKSTSTVVGPFLHVSILRQGSQAQQTVARSLTEA